MKYLKRIAIVLVLVLVIFTGVNVKAGYTYSHDGKIIVSPPGYSASIDGVYNVLSTAWNGNVTEKEFNSPEDLFIYDDPDTGEEVIYIVSSSSTVDDGVCYNTLFKFDKDLNFIEKVNQFEVIPDNFTNEELANIRTRQESSSVASSVAFTSVYSYEKIKEVEEIPYSERTESQKMYIKLLNISGVYRAKRAARDENNIIIENEFEDLVFLCDKGNSQIVIVDSKDYKVVQVVTAPKDTAFNTGDKKFSPTRLVTDTAGRFYVISDGFYEGIILLSNRGEFMRFVGVNYTSLSFWDALWRNIATEEQRKQQTSILNTKFTNITMDSQGFIYTVSQESTNPVTNEKNSNAMIKRINQAGKDVLVRNGYSVPKGDLMTILTGTNAGASSFNGITVNEYGMYTVVDGKAGRLFTYDKEGNLLYISAGNGVELTDLVNPVAVRYQGDNLLVLEKNNRAVIRFTPTEVGALINKAVKLQTIGRNEEASEEWQNVINQNPNYELAYIGVGKTYLEAGRYLDAMEYFKTGFSVSYYSKAYKIYRDEIIKKYFPWVMSIVVVAVLGKIGYNVYRNIRYKKKMKDAGDIDG